MGFRLSPGQIEAIKESTHSLNIWYGSVSSGKTFGWLMMMLGEIKTAGPNGSIVIMGKTLDSVYQNIFEPLMTSPIFASAAPYIFYRRRQPSAKIFGREVTVIGVNDVGAEGRIRGGTYQLVFYDELTLCPEPVWEMIWSRMRAVGNPLPPRVFATTNPATPTHYLKTDFIDRAEETDTYSRLFTMDDNPGLPPEYRARMRASYSGVFYRRMILGEWLSPRVRSMRRGIRKRWWRIRMWSIFLLWVSTMAPITQLPVTRWAWIKKADCACTVSGHRTPQVGHVAGSLTPS